ncbi:uncharacterized protein LOC135812913 [Sycon ciliatum]|uniref:uncharacterized protein LOC135812913 n=1 Tax=Sycon ciliatum TaxID=27933 RepID=UPI0031F6F80B
MEVDNSTIGDEDNDDEDTRTLYESVDLSSSRRGSRISGARLRYGRSAKVLQRAISSLSNQDGARRPTSSSIYEVLTGPTRRDRQHGYIEMSDMLVSNTSSNITPYTTAETSQADVCYAPLTESAMRPENGASSSQPVSSKRTDKIGLPDGLMDKACSVITPYTTADTTQASSHYAPLTPSVKEVGDSTDGNLAASDDRSEPVGQFSERDVPVDEGSSDFSPYTNADNNQDAATYALLATSGIYADESTGSNFEATSVRSEQVGPFRDRDVLIDNTPSDLTPYTTADTTAADAYYTLLTKSGMIPGEFTGRKLDASSLRSEQVGSLSDHGMPVGNTCSDINPYTTADTTEADAYDSPPTTNAIKTKETTGSNLAASSLRSEQVGSFPDRDVSVDKSSSDVSPYTTADTTQAEAYYVPLTPTVMKLEESTGSNLEAPVRSEVVGPLPDRMAAGPDTQQNTVRIRSESPGT